jgi:hypothetical protein
MMAQQAAALRNDGRGFAAIAEETRILANKIIQIMEQALFEGEELNKGQIEDIALQFNLLALNGAVESCHLGSKGKQVAVCADEIRNFAHEIAVLTYGESVNEKIRQRIRPWPKKPMSTISRSEDLLSFTVDGTIIYENLLNVYEIIQRYFEPIDGRLHIRGAEYPLLNPSGKLGKPEGFSCYVILNTPWAEKNMRYAVAVDSCIGIDNCPVGTPIDPPSGMPLAAYVRECWENENGEPFYFMDWAKMM